MGFGYTISGGNEDGTSDTLTFPSGTGTLSQVVPVTTTGDTAVEADEAVSVTLSSPSSNASISGTNNVGTSSFTDDDSAGLVINDISVNEDDGTATFTITLNGSTFLGTTVTYQTSDDTAISGEDYTNIPSSNVTFGTGNNQTRTVDVPLIDDNSLESTETFFLNLISSSSPFITIVDNRGIATIADDDNCAPAPVLDSNISTIFCDIIDRSLNDYTQSSAPSGTVLTWSRVSDPLNTVAHLTAAEVANPPNDGSYFGFFFDATNNCASNPIEVELTLNDSPTLTSASGDERCGPGQVTLTATGEIDGSPQPPTFNWYDSATGGNLVGMGSSLTLNVASTTSYYVEAIANGCPTERQEVIATIHPLPSAGIPTDASACSVSANGPTAIDLDDLISGQSEGEWTVTTDPSNSISTIPGDHIINFVDRPDGDYIFTYTTNNATPPFCENVSSQVTITVNDCDQDTDGDGLFDGPEVTLGTNPNNVDSDGDGIEDGVEVGIDIANPLDGDADGIIDALDSNILDADMDGVVDQLDPANTNACIPDVNNEFCVATTDLEITKTVSDNLTRPGENVSFSITVTNISNENATSIQVSDLLEEVNGFGYVSHFINPQGSGTYDEVTGLWDIPTLDSGGVVSLVILAEALEEGVFTNTAAILSSVPGDFEPDNNEASVEIEVSQRTTNECGFLFNQFSPNGDGINDFLVINCITEPRFANNTLEIYDRYGNQVYTANGYDNTWDGTRNDNELAKGTYFYILNIPDPDGQSEIIITRKGWIQIIR